MSVQSRVQGIERLGCMHTKIKYSLTKQGKLDYKPLSFIKFTVFLSNFFFVFHTESSINDNICQKHVDIL